MSRNSLQCLFLATCLTAVASTSANAAAVTCISMAGTATDLYAFLAPGSGNSCTSGKISYFDFATTRPNAPPLLLTAIDESNPAGPTMFLNPNVVDGIQISFVGKITPDPGFGLSGVGAAADGGTGVSQRLRVCTTEWASGVCGGSLLADISAFLNSPANAQVAPPRPGYSYQLVNINVPVFTQGDTEIAFGQRYTFTAVPEPATFATAAGALALIAASRCLHRKGKKRS